MCDCRVCSDYRRWEAALNPQTDEAKAALEEIMGELEANSTDAVYWRMKYQDTWPGDH
jgi:hypothetical protein